MRIALPQAAILLAAGALALSAQPRGGRRYNLSLHTGNAERCSDILARSTDGQVAQANDTVTLAAGQASGFELDDAVGRAIVQVRGWDWPEYTVETCKIAVGETRTAAEQLNSAVSVVRSAGRFTLAGPPGDDNWQIAFIVHAPKAGNVDVRGKHGPVSVAGMSGSVKVRIVNGPVSFRDCAGRIDAETTNGPISFRGGSGDVHLNATNGPISIDLAGDVWTGAQLNAHTENGPVSLSVPENYRSAVRFQTSNYAPLICRIDACRNAVTDLSSPLRTTRINGAADTIRLSTTNGPVSIKGPGKRVI